MASYLITCDPIISKCISASLCSEGATMANKLEEGKNVLTFKV